MFDNKNLVWRAMAEADVHRRYQGRVCDSLREQNKRLVISSWVASVTASVLALWDMVPVQISIGILILAAAFTTFRDIVRLPDRIADSRFILVGLNQEYDKMRILWETKGEHYPPPEYQSFLNVSRLHDLTTEEINSTLLGAAEADSRAYFDELKEQRSVRDSNPEPTRGLPLTSPPVEPPTTEPSPSLPGDGGGGRKAGLPTSAPPPAPPPDKE